MKTCITNFICEICNNHKGSGDHTQCSKERQRRHKAKLKEKEKIKRGKAIQKSYLKESKLGELTKFFNS